jgi:NIMA (never in mitosis gene a)-related kinase
LHLRPDVLKLADFGLARILLNKGDEFDSFNFSGANSPNFVSPEIAHQSFFSFPVDIWSIGAIIYQLMKLDSPFAASNSDRTLKLICNEDYPLPQIQSNYSKELKEVVYRMLEKDQHKRIHIEELIQNPLLSPINVHENPFDFFC